MANTFPRAEPSDAALVGDDHDVDAPAASPSRAAAGGRARRRSSRRLTWPEGVVLGAGALSIAAAHLMTLGYAKFANPDEAYAAAIAERLLEGHRLYDGAVSQRGPLMYYAFAAIAALFGWDDIVAIRVAALALSLAHFAGVYAAGRVLLSRRAAVVAGAVVAYALAFGLEPYEGIALHGEVLLVPPLVAAAVLGALGMRAPSASPDRRRLLVASGVLFGAAASIKQTVALQPLPLGIWLAAEAWTWRAKWRDASTELGLLVASTLSLPAAFALHAWREGTLGRLVYYCVTYNVRVHRVGGRWSLPAEVVQHYPCFLVAAGAVFAWTAARWLGRLRVVYRTKRRREIVGAFGLVDYVTTEFVVALLVAASLPQFFGHYYLVVLPFLALSLAALVDRVAKRGSRRHTVPAFVGIAGVYVVGAVQTAWLRERPDGRVAHGPAVEDVARYLTQHTAPADRIFVWGFSPWLYEYARRRPAGRFVFTTYPIGFVPWFWDSLADEPSRVVPGAMNELLDDLGRERPAYVVDAGSVLMARPMRAYAQAAQWLHDRYCFDVRIGAFDLYRLGTGERPCDTSPFPEPARAVNHLDEPLLVPTPPVVDVAASCPLPAGEADEPVRFDYDGPAERRPAARRPGVTATCGLAPTVTCGGRMKSFAEKTSCEAVP